MKFKDVDWYCWFVIVLIFGSLLVFFCYGFFGLGGFATLVSGSTVLGSYFIVDFVSYSLSFLSLLLLIVLLFFFSSLSFRCLVLVFFSVVASVLCYVSNHVFFFWWFYEVSILLLLYLLIVESPYSERYLAGWYLSGYVVLTSLPMLLCLVYFVSVSGSLFISDWVMLGLNEGWVNIFVCVMLGVLFITKIPLFPFHTWLPIVHAEATSIVSVCLSGYIMKLGLLGIYRYCWWVLPNILFCNSYAMVAFFFSLMFFLVASWELDGKRWLAFLSLSHISICVVCLCCVSLSGGGWLFIYSLGHGVSAGLVFVFLWWGYELSGSRNWMILKSVIGGSVFFRFFMCVSLCTAASLPPVVQFFIEISVLREVCTFNLVFFFVFCFYLLFSSLVPLFLVGFMMSRHYCVGFCSLTGLINYSLCVFLLVVWSFIVFLVV